MARWEANDDLVLLGYRVGGTGWVAVPGVSAFRFDDGGSVLAVPDGAERAEIEDVWVRSVLPLVVQARGTQVLHASAVRGRSGVVALCGTSTAGKSTLAAGLMRRGRAIVADDALAFDVDDGEAVASTLPFLLRLRPDSAASLGLPAVAAEGQGGDVLPLEAIVLLEPHDDERAPVLECVAAAEACGALMPHAYCFSLEDGKEALVEAYLALARLVPAWRLTFPRRLERLDEAVDVLQRVLDG